MFLLIRNCMLPGWAEREVGFSFRAGETAKVWDRGRIEHCWGRMGLRLTYECLAGSADCGKSLVRKLWFPVCEWAWVCAPRSLPWPRG